jgi:hypothetical protein
VDIDLTVDGGMTWNSIVTGAPNTGTYSWTIPTMFTMPSATCLIQVKSGMLVDQSMAYFQISHPSMTVVAPNGGQTLVSGQTYTITVNSTNAFGGALHYSTNGGMTWNFITNLTSGFPGSVNYNWTVPAISPAYSSNCLIRFNSGGPYADFSDSYFAITNTIDVTSPNGGEVLPALASHTITWNNTPGITSVLIQYSIDNGASWTIINPMAPTGPSGGSYTWSPIPATPSATCLVRVMDGMIPFIGDTSDANFTISSGTANVTAPNGGETWYVGSTQNITWTYTGPPSQYDIEYSTDNGTTWNLVATNVSVGAGGGSYAWVIPNTPSTQCLVRVTDMIDPTRTDVSNAVFTIAAPTITVVSPNGGESWLIGSTQTISWNSVGPISQVMIEYTSDGGTTWNLIAAPVPNGTGGGTYSWTVPATPSGFCIVRVSDFMLSSINDVSNAFFTITSGTATVTAPNGGETWYVGSTQNITWTYTGAPSQYNIDYSTNNGSTWSSVATNVSVGVGGGSYAWIIPNTPSNQCLVRVTDVTDVTRTDVSNAVFTIALPTITVTSPNGLENWVVGSNQTITWTTMGPVSSVDIFYSTDNGANWTNIATNQPNGVGGGSYSWTVPNTPSTQCLVRVSDFMIPTIVDQSDAVFTISANVPRSLTVVAPNGGESFTPGSTTNISWTFTGGVNQILIEYTTDNGTNWSTIATMPVTSSSYSWTIPNTPSNQCLVRITDVDSSYVMDMSDAHFEIQSLGMNSLYEVSVKVYPNPVTDFLFIQNNIDTPVQAEVYSLDGKLIYQAELLQVNTTIPMQAYKPGIYLVRIQNKVFKVTKQ